MLKTFKITQGMGGHLWFYMYFWNNLDLKEMLNALKFSLASFERYWGSWRWLLSVNGEVGRSAVFFFQFFLWLRRGSLDMKYPWFGLLWLVSQRIFFYMILEEVNLAQRDSYTYMYMKGQGCCLSCCKS